MFAPSQINMLIGGLISALFKNEDMRLKKSLYQIVNENRKLSNNKFDGFFFQERYYTDMAAGVKQNTLQSGLDPSLVPTMLAFVADEQEVNFDKRRVKQAIGLVIKDCHTAQDLRDALPNQLVEFIDQVKNLPRLRPEAFTLMDDPRKLKQYQELREKIEFYTVTRLLY